MQANLKITQFNLQQVVERMKAFVNQRHTPRMFQEGDHVFFTIIKKISDVAYNLQFPDDCKVHPIFHVSKLRTYISRDESCVDSLVALEDRTSQPYVLFQVLDKRERKLWNCSIQEYLVTWTNCPLTDANWESEALI
ncbi:hypothetical protein KP509_11G009700 [Ceratopteris richardii]|uniref:Chromo domain-containing protein n=1 Tax=Ceratopteris richardii TaxID=49495 RepID=A0A8T2TRT4_CERRI|nr:hypothetical protein KP509_11G009700 [Ceratopteris richardii]